VLPQPKSLVKKPVNDWKRLLACVQPGCRKSRLGFPGLQRQFDDARAIKFQQYRLEVSWRYILLVATMVRKTLPSRNLIPCRASKAPTNLADFGLATR
jgi:hypothetical protein